MNGFLAGRAIERPIEKWRPSATLFGVLLGIWVGLYPFIDLALRPRLGIGGLRNVAPLVIPPIVLVLYAANLAIGVVPLVWGVARFGLDFRRAKFFAFPALLMCLAVPLSLLSSRDLGSTSSVVLTYYVFLFVTLLISINVETDALLRPFGATLSLVLAVACAAAVIDHDFAAGRLMGHMAATYWGGLACVMIVSTLAIRNVLLKALIIGFGVYCIYLTQSRGVTLGAILGLCVAGLFYLRNPKVWRFAWLWLSIGIAALFLVGLGWPFIAEKVLLFSDPLRGASSGLTGRTGTWVMGWELFSNNPWFGVGYGQLSRYTSGVPIHNAYLSTLAEMGIVGFASYALLTLGALGCALARAWRRPYGGALTLVALLSMFSEWALIEPGGLRLGNTSSLVLILLSALAWRSDPLEAPASVSMRTVGGAVREDIGGLIEDGKAT
jgi:O-antigen ligase